MTLRTVGQPVGRIDGEEKVRGEARYAIDLKVPGMLHGRILRSPYPHARLLHVDAAKAAQLPGVRAVLTRDDILRGDRVERRYGRVYKDQSVVALDRVRYVGDPVAAVAAVDRETAEEALQLVEVEYEELPGVFDPVAAMAPDAPLLHEALGKQRNVCSLSTTVRGDVEQGWRESDLIVEETYTSATTQHCHLEPHGCIVAFDPSGRVTVWSGTQTPYGVKMNLAELFRLEPERVRVIVPYVGGGYGAKSHLKIEPIAAFLAWKSGAPVRIVLKRQEVFFTITKHGAVTRMKTGVKRDGTLVARQVEILYDTGAYAEGGPLVAKKAATLAAGPYKLAHVKTESYCIYTNKPSAGAFRGYGVPQVALAYESQMDRIAEVLGMDPLELRLKNVVEEGSRFATGEALHSVGFKPLLVQVAQAIGWGKAEGGTAGEKKAERGGAGDPKAGGTRRRGKGLAIMIKSSNMESTSRCGLQVNDDGTVTVLTSTVEMGQGPRTMLAQIVAEELALPLQAVRVHQPDTDVTPFDTMTTASRSTFFMGNAMVRAAAEARRQLVALASQLLEVRPDDLVVEGGRVSVRGSPDKGFGFGDLARRAREQGSPLQAEGVFEAKEPHGEEPVSIPSFYLVGAGAAEVEVDTETGQVRLLRYVAGADAGKALNPLLAGGQLRGDATIGIGQTFFEEMVFEGGQPVNATFLQYVLPSFKDIPELFDTVIVETPHRNGPYGAKGIAESTIACVAPAVGNAIRRAVGVRLRDLPFTTERVLRALAGLQDGGR
ncbi:MAG: xanthine dehydrogenase family protein molybdopterin-binding subunit [Deltaproteobacteria bacterium]|nr:xanthine dehydrogenase family protein molybdopterin-binding subunit [Deltaproteobacteria bacterium]